MTNYSLLIDADLCIGCQACEVACKQENNIPVGPRWIRALPVGPKEVGGELKMSFIVARCRHCADPPCIPVCPTDAITKRTDGIVLINPELCIGCEACIEACPFGSPQLNPRKGIIEKCTLCVHRIDQGLAPACFLACPTGAIDFGDTNTLIESKRERHAERFVQSSQT